ncbi:uncharacterized protein LOC114355932 [Ostrinia furnacalis]|uniref:uncharacterized protein LOC114355932 n=1 Tax=Ostrinia furnacalis TaxID=93504 RepID=UPI00103D993C|nr:uncharacterized protein LOC114355932 [Ostrinia furnacalis]
MSVKGRASDLAHRDQNREGNPSLPAPFFVSKVFNMFSTAELLICTLETVSMHNGSDSGGTISADFHLCGKTPSRRERLNMSVKGRASDLAHRDQNREGNPSLPAPFFVSKVFNMFSTAELLICTLETVSMHNGSDSGAPQFICPKDDNATVEKPDNTVITLQTAADADMRIDWTVRWTPLVAPTQRFTLLLWKAVRALEARLNQPQPEPYVYVIENSQMLKGVNYIFNVSSVESNGDVSEPKCFNIDNTQGDHELTIEGRSDMFSVVLVGAQAALADVTYVVEAQVTTCTPTQDYYFAWSVQSLSTDDMVNVSHIQGSRLEVPPHTLRPGLVYSASCQVIRASNGNFITQTSLPFGVRFRGLEVYLSIDYLRVTINQPFSIESIVINHDYYGNPVTFAWKCTYNDEDCNIETDLDGETLIFPSGLCDDGE